MRFLGNKTRMIKNIREFIEENNIEGEIFCDLFSGSASVCDYFKDEYKIIANDVLETAYIFAKAKINNSGIPKFENFYNVFDENPFDYFSQRKYEFDENHFIWGNYSPKGERQFFTEAVANQIDGIRLELETLKKEDILNDNEYTFLLASLLETVMGLSNTSGTYEAFLKKWDKRAFKDFELLPLEMKKCDKVDSTNTVYNEDANVLIRKISGDILYLDTPYTITNYDSAYHLLETISKYDMPSIKGKTGRRVNKKEKSPYSSRNRVALAYEDLISNANFNNIVISYSTQSLLPIDDLIKILEKYTKDNIVIKYYPFREYKNIRASKKGDNLKEVLIYMKKEKVNNGMA